MEKEIIIKGFNVHKHDLEYYLTKHPLARLNTRIYENLVKNGGTTFDVAEMFDEAYYIATKAYHDKYPANNFYSKFDIKKDNELYNNDKYKYVFFWWAAYFIIRDQNQVLKRGNLEEFMTCCTNEWPFSYGYIKEQKKLSAISIDVDMLKGYNTIDDYNPSDEEAKKLYWDNYDFPLDAPLSPLDVYSWKFFTDTYNGENIRYIVLSYNNSFDAKNALKKIKEEWISWEENLPFGNDLENVYKYCEWLEEEIEKKKDNNNYITDPKDEQILKLQEENATLRRQLIDQDELLNNSDEEEISNEEIKMREELAQQREKEIEQAFKDAAELPAVKDKVKELKSTIEELKSKINCIESYEEGTANKTITASNLIIFFDALNSLIKELDKNMKVISMSYEKHEKDIWSKVIASVFGSQEKSVANYISKIIGNANEKYNKKQAKKTASWIKPVFPDIAKKISEIYDLDEE